METVHRHFRSSLFLYNSINRCSLFRDLRDLVPLLQRFSRYSSIPKITPWPYPRNDLSKFVSIGSTNGSQRTNGRHSKRDHHPPPEISPVQNRSVQNRRFFGSVSIARLDEIDRPFDRSRTAEDEGAEERECAWSGLECLVAIRGHAVSISNRFSNEQQQDDEDRRRRRRRR